MRSPSGASASRCSGQPRTGKSVRTVDHWTRGAVGNQRANRHPTRDGGKSVARHPVVGGVAGGAGGLYESGDDVGQAFVARDRLENLAARDGVRSGAATDVDRDGVHNFSVDLRLEPSKADIRRLVIAAARGAARPMNRERRSVRAESFFQRLRKSDGAALRFDQSHIAVIGADARDQAAHKWRWTRREKFYEPFFQQIIDAIVADIRNDGVLADREANFAITVFVGETRQLFQLIGIDATGGYAKADGDQPCLALRYHAKMIGVAGAAHVFAAEFEFVAEAREEFAAQAANAPLFDQESEATFRAGFARTVIAKDFDELGDDGDGFERFDENVERRRDSESARAHFAADEHVESEAAAFASGNEGEILRLIVGAVVEAARDGDVEFARKICVFGIAVGADENAIEFLHDVRRIEEFVGREAGERAAVDVADVVDAGLERAKIDATQLFPDFRNAVEREAAQFELLARGDVENIVAEAAREIGDGAKLRAGGESIGHADAHHEFAGRRAAEEDADPLEQFFFGGRQGAGAAGDDFGKIVEHAQAVAVFGGFVALDGVGAWFSADVGRLGSFARVRDSGVAESRGFQDGLRSVAADHSHRAPAREIGLVLERCH